MNAAALEKENLHPALTILSEEEEQFRAAIREFAEGEVRPRVEEMEKEAHLDQELIKQCFELGLMAIETPEEYGGAGSTFFNAILAIEELARVDASTSVFVDVQNTLVTNAFIRWANDDLKKKYLPQMAESKVGAYALSEAGSGSDAFALKTKASTKAIIGKSTGKNFGLQTATKRRFLSFSLPLMPKPVTKESRHLSSKKILKDSPLAKKKTNSAFARLRRPN